MCRSKRFWSVSNLLLMTVMVVVIGGWAADLCHAQATATAPAETASIAAAEENVTRPTGGIGGIDQRLLAQAGVGESHQGVLHVFEGAEHGLAVGGELLFAQGVLHFHLGAQPAGVEDRTAHRRGQGAGHLPTAGKGG
ncbi:MAG TPA: hypothetical protein PLT93_14670, partial [Phycisphaerae bacterium]|nr:hypothetical protein [Phycisphaerae bacterium]